MISSTIWTGRTIFQFIVLRVSYQFHLIILIRDCIRAGEYDAYTLFTLDVEGNKSKREFYVHTTEYNITTIKITFERLWAQRNTGMRLSWYYLPQQNISANPMFVEDNKLFILLANVVHQQGVTAEIEQHIREITIDPNITVQMKWQELRGERLLELYANYSKKPIYKDDISYETLDITAEIYSRLLSPPISCRHPVVGCC